MDVNGNLLFYDAVSLGLNKSRYYISSNDVLVSRNISSFSFDNSWLSYGGRVRGGLLMILHHEVYCVFYNYCQLKQRIMGNQKCIFSYPITNTTILFSATATIVYKKGETHHLHPALLAA